MQDDFILLRQKAINGFLLSVEFFNRPWNQGRVDAVLILLGHACEMLLKAAIVHKGGDIYHKRKKGREQGEKWTFSLRDCIQLASTEGRLPFLSADHVVSLRAIGSYRNAAQHYHIDVSENLLYCLTGNGIGVFRDVMNSVFNEDSELIMPRRVLSIAAIQPLEIVRIVASDIGVLKKALIPKGKERTNAVAKIRGLAAMENALTGNDNLPDNVQLKELCEQISAGISMDVVFPGITAIDNSRNVKGTIGAAHLTENQGRPVHIMSKSDAPESTNILVTNVFDVTYGHVELGIRLGLNSRETSALVHHLKIQEIPGCFSIENVGKAEYKRYHPKALHLMQKHIPTVDWDKIKAEYSLYLRKKRRKKKTK